MIGIVKKNAIMMIDFALDAERQGRHEPGAIDPSGLSAALPADHDDDHGGPARRLAALAIGTGTGSELRRPLGIAIVGGLIVSQFLTLYTTPVIYLFFERVRLMLARRFGASRVAEPQRQIPLLPVQRRAQSGRGGVGRMAISEAFIRRPVATVLLAIGVMLLGHRRLPRSSAVAALPNVDLPIIRVSASLPGADPETVAASLATPLERQLGTISGR